MGYQYFSTRGLRAPERIELWEHHNAHALLSLACRSTDDEPLEADEANLHLSRLSFAHVRANAHVVERTRSHIAHTATDGAVLYFSLAGDAFFYHPDGVHLQRPGTLLVCDVNVPFFRGFAKGLSELVVTVPKAVFEDVAERPLPSSPLVLGFAEGPGGDAHAAALARVVRDGLAHPDSAAETEEQALELLRSLFSTDGAESPAARRRVAIGWIERNLRDPSISVSTVAKAIGVSERQLARAFAETGTGVARVILEMRLGLAHRILSRPGAPTVQDVAMYCGFVSASHFSRVFRERFEQSPAEVRAAARARA
jgi:AraC-like DNA-binding protein